MFKSLTTPAIKNGEMRFINPEEFQSLMKAMNDSFEEEVYFYDQEIHSNNHVPFIHKETGKVYWRPVDFLETLEREKIYVPEPASTKNMKKIPVLGSHHSLMLGQLPFEDEHGNTIWIHEDSL